MDARLRNKVLLYFHVILFSGYTADAFELELKPRVELSTSVVRLQDVAELAATSPTLQKRLRRIELFPVPATGKYRIVRRRELREILALHGIDTTRVRFRGPQASQVTAVSEPPTTPEPVVAAKIEVPSIVVAARPLPAGHVLRGGDLTTRAAGPRDQKELEHLAHEVPPLLGMSVQRSVKAGTAIDRRRLQKPHVVRRGEVVRVTARGAGVRVSTNARALANAAVNDVISVESLTDRRRFVVRVTGLLTAEIYASNTVASEMRKSELTQ